MKTVSSATSAALEDITNKFTNLENAFKTHSQSADIKITDITTLAKVLQNAFQEMQSAALTKEYAALEAVKLSCATQKQAVSKLNLSLY
jgi:hypothetical protein